MIKVWEEKVTFKTYLTGEQDRHPIFLEHRVYQGSSGAVYPYGVTDTLLDRSEMREYKAVYLENDYLKIMILPELGGRVQRAFDKVNGKDFVYFNSVIKPALVGLLGPWISGGIEFNWPQHHRPTTFMPVDFSLRRNSDGSATVFVGEREPMHGLTVSTAFTLYPDRALLEIKSRVYNGNDTPRTFLWWSNPAVKGGDGHQSVFPPDVTAVFDHGKRAVIDFPIAHGEYYKVRYDGEDISRYKNLPVPTSYMAWRSDYDFVGAYNHDEGIGLLHVADHHISPGKKQWSWGYGDFGQAWDRSLTDSDGPYIELMTGVYTDNQPDFTWLDAGEEKEFVQNFMPYSGLGTLQNANTKAAIKMERDGAGLNLGVYAAERLKGRVTVREIDGRVLCERDMSLEPCRFELWSAQIPADASRLVMELKDGAGRVILSHTEHVAQSLPLPEVAKAPAPPCDIASADECYFIGRHLEQYHHATRQPADYYLRGLETDPADYRCNTAMGSLEYNRCNYEKALEYAERALSRAHVLNRNHECAKGSLLRANCLMRLGRIDEAFDEYFRATWAANGRTCGYAGLSLICCRRGDFEQALGFAGRALQSESRNQEALALQCYAACGLGSADASSLIERCVELYPLNAVFRFLKAHHARVTGCSCEEEAREELRASLNDREINHISVAEFLLKADRKDLCLEFFNDFAPKGAVATLIFASLSDPERRRDLYEKAESEFDSFVRFPNLIFERDALGTLTDSPFALHLCAGFDYAHREYERARALWQKCLELDPECVGALRGLGIHAFNKLRDHASAVRYFDAALRCAPADERLVFEHDLLLKLTHRAPEERLAVISEHCKGAVLRDDLKAEIVTLYNQTGRLEEAERMLRERTFHVWEGGEGRVTGQYVINAVLRADALARDGRFAEALEVVEGALSFPHNLGEGRLVVQTDNDLYFFAALYAHRCRKTDLAEKYAKLARVGDTAITEQRYYNDLPADYVFYNAMAMMASGDLQQARSVFESMRRWSYSSYDEPVSEDFFAVSLPDLVVLDRDLAEDRRANCLLMRMLAAVGLNDRAAFDACVADFEALQPSNFRLSLYRRLADSLFAVSAKGGF